MNHHEGIDGGLIRALGHKFIDPTLLITALTHKSVSESTVKNHGYNNERLEFLGDAVLSLVTAYFLYRHNSSIDEGDLSRMRAQFVCQDNLSLAAKRIGLSEYIMSDKAMRASGSNNSKSILADALEAVIGAIFIDGGLAASEAAIFKILGTPSTTLSAYPVDAKTKLQELVQATLKDAPRYVVLEKNGPAHAPTFLVGVLIKEQLMASAAGENKKVAAQNAAAIALEKFENARSELQGEQ